jgi:hypothetical protein
MLAGSSTRLHRSDSAGAWLHDRSSGRPRARRVGDGDTRDRARWQAADRGCPGADQRGRTAPGSRQGGAGCAGHPVRNHRCRRPAELARATGGLAMAEQRAGRDFARHMPTPRCRRPWHAQKPFAREPGDIFLAVPASRGRDVVGKAGGRNPARRSPSASPSPCQSKCQHRHDRQAAPTPPRQPDGCPRIASTGQPSGWHVMVIVGRRLRGRERSQGDRTAA